MTIVVLPVLALFGMILTVYLLAWLAWLERQTVYVEKGYEW